MKGLRARLIGHAASNMASDADPAVARDYYQGVIDSVASVIFTADRELRITGVIRQWAALARAHVGEYLPSGRILGTPVLSLMKGLQLERWRTVCQQILNGEISRYLDEVAREQAVAWRNYSLSASPLGDSQGEIVGHHLCRDQHYPAQKGGSRDAEADGSGSRATPIVPRRRRYV